MIPSLGTLRLLAWGLLALVPAAAKASHGAEPAGVRAVGTIGMTVSDLDRSRAFFVDVLGFAPEREVEIHGDDVERLHGVFGMRARVALLRLGGERVELSQYLAPQGRPIPVEARSNDRSFQHIAIVVRDMRAAYQHLRAHGVRHASSGPQRLPDWNPAAGGIEAFYFKDPDGHVLEVIAFPPDKGEARWQRRDQGLFLGIDHTAIVVDDSERSLAFYRDRLGLRVAGASENWGPEQERLNNVFGARLRITALRADEGPGVELLEYLTPRDGRDMPGDVRANDLLHWHVRMALPSLDSAQATLLRGPSSLVSPGAVSLPENTLGFVRGLRLRDPDGHIVELVEQVGP